MGYNSGPDKKIFEVSVVDISAAVFFMMAEKTQEKSNGPSKSFMTIGPTLHYSHSNVRRCWALAVIVFFAMCFFWLKILTGATLSVELGEVISSSPWSLGHFTVSPLSIYEYPWQILVFGLVMGTMGVCPVIVSQLLSFRYSLLMVLAVVFVAKLPLFGVFLLVSCVAVACRPLRFRSRFIAIALCTAPQLIYWGVFGGTESVDPIRWGFSLAPWICAWLTGLWMAGAVIAIGHYTRYRPGLVWSISLVVLLTAFFVFEAKVSFSELDYQLYIAKNNPEEVREFHGHPLGIALDDAIKDPVTRRFLAGGFYPTDPILLRTELKREIGYQLGRYNQWPNWFTLPEELNYQDKRGQLLQKYEQFISKRPKSKRMPIALYYKAMLNEYRPDIRYLGQTETLSFYSDYPHHETLPIWYKLYDEFPQSSESLEARWRIAVHLAGRGEFARATDLCEAAEVILSKQAELLQESPSVAGGGFFTVFRRPAETIMTARKLRQLQEKLYELEILISDQNYTESEASEKRLARFVILNEHSEDYSEQLDNLLSEMQAGDPLRDNVLLEKVMLISDIQQRAKKFKELGDKYANTDGGIRALYELGMLKVGLWKNPDAKANVKTRYLSEARTILTSFIELYPGSVLSGQAQTMLDSLPAAD